jgi:hypothetical protein
MSKMLTRSSHLKHCYECTQIYHTLPLSKHFSYDVKNFSVNTLKIMTCYKKCQELTEDGVDERRRRRNYSYKVISLQIVRINRW